eukprot:gnl/TRDRNA2_/TRDRNA2_84746_c1_seq1.p1 gnl/TRDRNA2_/TRDRNA2_84746_c1~~gnl/TRDRNA2_/TRDRNA2_84746_c1_seq1.p1  ORF type:complete len:482 (-),score=52.51 gnl/TRDRNA2_/TRDRNA2_84746_c1_seq1:23-1285(-)
MKPEGKVSLVEELQALGRYVGMCGDGGNDCGALRAAHAGLALSSADASIVAPFSSGNDTSLFRIGELLSEGRACLSTNSACYAFFVCLGLGVTTLKVVLMLINGSIMGENQFIYLDLLIGIVLPWGMMKCQSAEKLSPYRPSSSLLEARMAIMCAGSQIIFVVFLFAALKLVRSQSFYERWDPAALGIHPSELFRLGDNFETEVAFLVLAAHDAACSLVYSYGSHHRGPLWRNRRLLSVYAFAVGILLFLLFAQNTFLNSSLRVNCDSTVSRDCLLGPQMMHWSDNQSQLPKSQRIPLAKMVSEATNGTSPACVPSKETMESQHVPKAYREAKSISLRFSFTYCWQLLGLLLLHSLMMHLFHYFVVLSKFFDDLERRGTRGGPAAKLATPTTTTTARASSAAERRSPDQASTVSSRSVET